MRGSGGGSACEMMVICLQATEMVGGGRVSCNYVNYESLDDTAAASLVAFTSAYLFAWLQ